MRDGWRIGIRKRVRGRAVALGEEFIEAKTSLKLEIELAAFKLVLGSDVVGDLFEIFAKDVEGVTIQLALRIGPSGAQRRGKRGLGGLGNRKQGARRERHRGGGLGRRQRRGRRTPTAAGSAARGRFQLGGARRETGRLRETHLGGRGKLDGR